MSIVELFKNKKVGFIGFGKSNISLAKFLLEHFLKEEDTEIFFTESLEEKKFVEQISKLNLLNSKIQYEFGGHSEKILDCDIIIKSPGISNNNELVQKIKQKQIPIFNELEISYRLIVEKLNCIPKIVAITGTNGKTTTTTLIGKICGSYFKEVFVAGNIGVPMIEYYDKITNDSIIILEVSSYQLEDISEFKPYISCILNITEDHLEHHGNMQNYVASKSKIFMNQTKTDFLVLNYDNKIIYRMNIRNIIPKKIYFSTQTRLVEGCFWFNKSKKIIFVDEKFNETVLVPKINIPGLHNIENILASVICAFILKVPKEIIEKSISEFNGVEHRLEFVRKVDSVDYINDSKGTNVDSTIVALKSFDNPIHLILGGRDKGAPYTPLIPLINSKVKSILLIGESTDVIYSQLKYSRAEIYKCETLENAIKKVKSIAKRGEIVLFSPACSSFDQFNNFEHRGKVFKDLVNRL